MDLEPIAIAADVFWLGESDRRLERFENIHPLADGMSYNAYLIAAQKTALLDTTDAAVAAEFLNRLKQALGGRALDYLVVHHAEPDHGAALAELCRRFPALKIAASQKARALLAQFNGDWVFERCMVVGEGDRLDLGGRELRFFAAPMVHWPEVLMSYEPTHKILFSADAFGAFGALSGNVFADTLDYNGRFLAEARRYYANIVGKYGPQVQAVLKKLPLGEIETVCSLHGPVLRRELGFMLDKYDRWSRYEPEQRGVVIAYGSMYGNTKAAADALAEQLAQRGVSDIRVHDVSRTHPSYVIADLFQFSHLVLAAPTYNNSLYIPMQTLLDEMAVLNLQNRAVVLLANGSWAPRAHTLMRERLEQMQAMRALGEPLVLTSRLRPEQFAELAALADTIAADVLQ